MTTASLEHDAPTRTPAAAHLGALAGITPVVMFIAWSVIAPWSDSVREFLVLLAAVVGISVGAGWIVGARSGRSIRSGLLDVIAFPTVAWLIFLPIGAIASVAFRIADASEGDPGAMVASTAFLLVYGLVGSLYVIPLLTPFGAGWALTYLALRRGMAV